MAEAGLLLLMAYLIGWLGAAGMIRFADRSGRMDVPGTRSSHIRPTPTSGGLGFVLAMTLALLWLAWSGGTALYALMAVIGLGLGLAGWLDDRVGLTPATRLMMQFLALSALFYELSPLPHLFLTSHFSLGGPALFAIGLLFAVWWVNLFNFMDGIDGLAGMQAVFMLGSGAALAWWNRPELVQDVAWQAMLAGMAAVLGFLKLNWPPARVFMGDAGSVFLGFMLIFLSLQTIHEGWLSYAVWAILGALFIVDASVTLVVRVRRGQRPHQAHRSHVYQRLSRRWQTHRSVTLTYLGVNLLWLFPLAACALFLPGYSLLFVLLAYAPLIIMARVLGGGRGDLA